MLRSAPRRKSVRPGITVTCLGGSQDPLGLLPPFEKLQEWEAGFYCKLTYRSLSSFLPLFRSL